MGSQPEPNTCAPSTTFEWRRVKVAKRPKGIGKPGVARPPLSSLSPSSGPLTITVEYRGGSEDWWHLKARGKRWVLPGHRQLTDVLLDVYRGEGYRTD